MAEPLPDYRMVTSAGEVLRRTISAEDRSDCYEAFNVGHQWLAAHLTPMHRTRIGLGSIARSIDFEAIVAGRIKRMSSVRKKLRRSKMSLWEMQDLAGIRAVLRDHRAVEEVAARYEEGASRQRLAKQRDYILEPKDTGYRSRHLMLRFVGDGDAAPFAGRSVELQLRTRLQHSWATAVEAVGLMSGQDLKAGQGSEEWLRLFRLMSAQFADDEGLPGVPGQPTDRNERVEQIRVLDRYLDALTTLEGYKHAINRISGRWRDSRGGRFVVTFDAASKTVRVAPVTSIAAFLTASRAAEGAKTDSVVVEVDRIDSLAEAYPNYFADVTLFARKLSSYLRGRDGTYKHPLGWLASYHWRRA